MAAIDARDARNDVLLACTIGDISWLKRGFSNGAEPTATNDEVRGGGAKLHYVHAQLYNGSNVRGTIWRIQITVLVCRV